VRPKLDSEFEEKIGILTQIAAQIMGKKLICGPKTNLGWTPLA
jgi:hypothetical protein